MMEERILLTGVTGFIGRNVARALLAEKHQLTALVRPSTPMSRLGDLAEQVRLVHIGLDDMVSLKEYLNLHHFKAIVHIGALRGGRKADRHTYELTNVQATEQLALNALHNHSRFIFCSSVGVFGAIPCELPACDATPRKHDSLYHDTKIHAEAIVQHLVLDGLDAMIVRPAITYGSGDDGFPNTLIHLVAKHMMYLPNRPVRIHLTNVNLLTRAFTRLVEAEPHPGRAYIVADPEPVSLHELCDAIHKRLHGTPFPASHIVEGRWFDMGAAVARKLHKDTWTARFELISKHWFYDVADAYRDLKLPHHKTMNEFMSLVDEYKRKH